MAVFGGFGFDSLDSMRNESRKKKAETAAAKTPASQATAQATEKPLTNTSGTAKPKGAALKRTGRQVQFGLEQGGAMGAVAGFMGVPFTKRVGGRPMTVDVLNQQIVTAGSKIKMPEPTVKKAPPPPADTGIDAPAPDTGWRPSGVNSALGLQQTTLGVPLQETIGVSKRKR